uniref:Uncharacterized protein n=1 Tax=Strongyloides papillosus TaxID=174720 RepID=A0A0N5BES5_STREA
MAPPERYPLAEFGDKKSYSKFLNLVTSHMAEDEKVNCIMASIPKEWKNTFLRKIIQTDEDAKLTSDGLLKLVEEEFKCQVESEPVAVRVNKLFTTRFPFKEKNACSKIIDELEN